MQGHHGTDDIEGLTRGIIQLETVQVIDGELPSAVVKHAKGSFHMVFLENTSDLIINGNIVDSTCIEGKYGKENDKKRQDPFHDDQLWR